MPVFEVEANGRNFQIDAPDMATATAGLQQHLAAPDQQVAQPEAPSLGFGGTLKDVLHSTGTGFAQGVIGIAGLPAALGSLAAQGSDYLTGSNIGPAAQRLADRYGPAALQQKAENVVGKFYEPKSTLGSYAQTLGEFLPAVAGGPEGVLGRLLTRAVIPAAVSETAGQVLAGTDAEPYGRAAGAIVGGFAPSALRRAATPFAVPAERAAAVSTLANEGVTVPASMATGSKALKAAESELGGGAYGDAVNRMNDQFTAATLRRAGINETRATPDVLNNAADQIGAKFDSVAARNPTIPVSGFDKVAGAIAGDYQRLTGSESPLLNDLRARVTPTLSGDVYQVISSDISRNLRATSSPELKLALGDFKSALDKAVESGLKDPRDAAAWAQARREWKNLLVVQKAVGGSTEASAAGLITPAKLTQAIESMKRGSYAKGQGDFADLARAGNAIMKPLQDSGTAARLKPTAIGAALGAAVASGGATLPHTLAAIAVPAIGGRVLMSRPAQAYLKNQRYAPKAGALSRNVGAAGVLGLAQGQRQP